MTHWPVFWDIETTGLNPLAQDFWSGTMAAQVTAVGLATVRNWDDGVGTEGAQIEVEVVYDNDEYRLLNGLADVVRSMDWKGDPFLVGYNSRRYDHPYITARYGRLRQDPEPFASEWKRLDMQRVAGEDEKIPKRYPKQEEYAEVLGVDIPDEYDGSDMPEAFENNEWDKIKSHAEADVIELAEMFLERKGLAMTKFFDHYDIDADGAPVETVEIEEHGPPGQGGNDAHIDEIELDLGEE